MFQGFDWIQAMSRSPVMVLILTLSVVTFGFAIERLIYYGRRRGNAERIFSHAFERARRGDIKEAIFGCGLSPHPFGRVAAEILGNANGSPEAQEEKLQIAISEQRLLLERNLSWIGTMGKTAPLIGLLGTVWGIMRAFHDMAHTGSAGPSVVAAGVAEALFTTAAGLLIAVPAVMLYNYFVRRMGVMLTETENMARRLRLALEEQESSPRSMSRPTLTRVA